MKSLKRLSVATLVLVMVLTAVFAIPASAYSIGSSHEENITCACGNSVENGFGNLIDSNDKTATRAITHLNHDCAICSSATTYVSAKFWHYPSASSSAYNATTRTDTKYSEVSTAVVQAAGNGVATIPGEIFCIESNHRITMVCRGTTYTYSKYLCTGEPSLK